MVTNIWRLEIPGRWIPAFGIGNGPGMMYLHQPVPDAAGGCRNNLPSGRVTAEGFPCVPYVLGFLCILCAVPAMAESPGPEPVIGLVIKTEDNPFFVSIRDAALDRAKEHGVELRAFSGEYDGDAESQAAAIGRLVDAGAGGILITPSDPQRLAGAVGKAREAGIPVIALDTPFDPAVTVDGTFATDNFRAGELIGNWARLKMASKGTGNVRIAMLDGYREDVTVDLLRSQGFLRGFGIDIGDPGVMRDEHDHRIVGRGVSHGTKAGGWAAMEKLIGEYPEIDLVYTINEPAAAGARAALESAGMENEVLVVSIDGGCRGIEEVASGAVGATAMQYPSRMAVLGVDAVVEYIRTGTGPENSPGLDFADTGVTLVTDEPVPGVPSITAEEGLELCWQ